MQADVLNEAPPPKVPISGGVRGEGVRAPRPPPPRAPPMTSYLNF